jgi:hypothetical protein
MSSLLPALLLLVAMGLFPVVIKAGVAAVQRHESRQGPRKTGLFNYRLRG